MKRSRMGEAQVLAYIARHGTHAYLQLFSSGKGRQARWRVLCRDGAFMPWARIVCANKLHPTPLPDDYEVDHINENRLDDRPENLIALSKEDHVLAARFRRDLRNGKVNRDGSKKDGEGNTPSSGGDGC